MTRTYVFVSYELAPINPGGCGVFIWSAIHELLQDPKNQIILLLDMPLHECQLFSEQYQSTLPNPDHIKVECLQTLLQDLDLPAIDHFRNLFLWKSFQFYCGLKKISFREKVDFIEFFDYVGIGYFSIQAKKYEGQFRNCILAVRAHCTIDLMDLEQNQLDFKHEKLEMYQMEKDAIRNADILLAPSKGWGQIYAQRYKVTENKIKISTPPVKAWEGIEYKQSNEKQDVLFYGRIFQLKGVDLYIDAALSYISLNPTNRTRFFLVGYDGLDANGVPYKEQLLKRIPNELQKRFVFTGQLNRKELEKILQTIRFSIFPNFVESFCYSIHELYNLGVPVICNSIPAFQDFFTHERNALFFDGSSADLMRNISRLFEDDELLRNLSRPYTVVKPSEFIEVYNSNEIFIDNHQNRVEIPFDLSLIIINESPIPVSFDQINKFHQLPGVNPERSYVLNSAEGQGMPVAFLGKMRYARKLDLTEVENLKIGEHYLVCYLDDNISPVYLTKSKQVFLNNSDVQYVGCYNSGKQTHPLQYELHRNNPYMPYEALTRMICRGKNNSTLRDIYDIRYGAYAERLNVNKEGYVIPEVLIHTSDYSLDISSSQNVLFSHSLSKEREWMPFELWPYLSMESNSESRSNQEIVLKRKIYHRLKARVDGMSGVKGKLAGKILQLAYRVAKRS
ncbi:hypothetical protein PAECIP111893_00439 [Paenibacillus plantiphilus]|uniref:Glycosyl transferase family 1 domain-containing protein n=1 Tax=Paenibacillus plantiphilus TaxID=2905650 RepID=A0ABN8FVR8_9BACL|nr:glycosyltransferase family 4 protein [Paenibacillus plantiphilus]CAH1193345.1 hypothetical protein PAECIP111893_00439 [Paenibacillus plantiphilus]